MKASQGKTGRVFMVRLEDGDVLPDCLQEFAAANAIMYGHVVLVGGIGGGEVVAGPRRSDTMPPDPVQLPVDGAHEVVGVGIIAPDQDGQPVLHLCSLSGNLSCTRYHQHTQSTTAEPEGQVVWAVLQDNSRSTSLRCYLRPSHRYHPHHPRLCE